MKISKTKALEVLRKAHEKASEWPESELSLALEFAIDAVNKKRDYAKYGTKGGNTTLKRFGKKGMREFGKLGGRPKSIK